MITSDGRGMHADSIAINRTMPGQPEDENDEMRSPRGLRGCALPSVHSRKQDDNISGYPTVMNGGPIERVGWASPTGTPWPSLPHVPMANPRSDPTRSIIERTSGPFPVIVAPRTGSPRFPPSIRYPSATSNMKSPVTVFHLAASRS